ncbi:MAG: iron chelate uptake ABC transporter family permease subunit, partial [Armatimonadetes bacterium]|nr:iron chelate uptake ABC transporter family permease subunit [Armatimonadota bacterium]
MTARRKVLRHRRAVLLVLALLLAGAMVVGAGVGPVAVSPGEVVRSLRNALAGRPIAGREDAIVRHARLPRVALSAVVGAGLAAAGAAL